MALALAVALALAFSVTNGFLDAANAVATLVATRGASPGPAILASAAFNFLGAVLLGTAVAGTVAGIVTVSPAHAVAAVGAAALAAASWNMLMWWRALPSSSGHSLLGGLVGAGLAAGGAGAVRWGGMEGLHPRGVAGVLIALALSPLIGLILGAAALAAERMLLRRARRRAVREPIRVAEWALSAALSFSHGANDGQKGMGLVVALLIASGHLQAFAVPLWVKLACAAALTLGTSMGGWRVVRTVGRGIMRLAPIDSLASQSSSTAVILAFSLAGGPISSTHVVASSVIGAGAGRRRFAHIRWQVVRQIAFGWVATFPGAIALGALYALAWMAIA